MNINNSSIVIINFLTFSRSISETSLNFLTSENMSQNVNGIIDFKLHIKLVFKNGSFMKIDFILFLEPRFIMSIINCSGLA